MDMEGRIGVLGGGISGLTFASLMPEAEVLEKELVPGGLMRSVKEEGYTFDLGSHIIFSRNQRRWRSCSKPWKATASPTGGAPPCSTTACA